MRLSRIGSRAPRVTDDLQMSRSLPRISAGGGVALGGESRGADQRHDGNWRSGGCGETPVRGERYGGMEFQVTSYK